MPSPRLPARVASQSKCDRYDEPAFDTLSVRMTSKASATFVDVTQLAPWSFKCPASLCMLVRDRPWSFGPVRLLSRNLLRQCCDGRNKTRQEMASGSGPTREAISLTTRSIEALRPAEAAYRVPDQRCIGLAVRVAPSGIKTWDLAYRIRNSGKTRRLSLGRVSDVALEKARERANELTSTARTGRDLIAEEEEKRAAVAARITIEQLIELYVRRRVTGRLRTAKEIERRLKRALTPIMQRHAEDIRRKNLRELFDQCADNGIEREAERRRQTVGAMFRWALSQDIVEIDPTAGLKAYDPGTPRDRVLSIEEIKSLWEWLDSDDLPRDPADILKLELLTGARCGEISGLCWEEVNRDEWIWTLPAARSKTNGHASPH
ncbi:MAG: integrase arm-type DNA-binding domain-containing protein [Pseudolabrys sp.]